jgi:hypothetical protein
MMVPIGMRYLTHRQLCTINTQHVVGRVCYTNVASVEQRYGWIPHNAGFGFLDPAPSILHSNWFWDYIS